MRIHKWLMKRQDSFEKNLEAVLVEVQNIGNVFHYRYESALGLCELKWYQEENRMTLEREGEAAMHLEVLVGGKTELQYQNSFYRDTFVVEGISCKGDLNFLDFSYRLLEKNGEKINEVHIQMKRRV